MGIITQIRKNGFNVAMEEFFSCKDVVETSNKRKICCCGFEREDVSSGWYGVESWEKVEELMTYGYTEKIEIFKKMFDAKIQRQEEKRITFKNDVMGYVPIVPLALLGVPNNMINSAQKKIKSKVVKVIYNVNFGGYATPSEIQENGRKLLSALINLELQGYRIELSVCYCCGGSRGFDCLKIRVKEANQPFSLQRMMYPIVHPSMFRTIGFDWESRFEKHILSSVGSGHSPAYEYHDFELDKFNKTVFGEDAIVFYGKFIKDKNEKYIEEIIKNECDKNK